MADVCDMAEEQSQRALAAALERARAAAQTVGAGSAECQQCGEGIPLARRRAVPSCVTCISCQQMLERRRR